MSDTTITAVDFRSELSQELTKLRVFVDSEATNVQLQEALTKVKNNKVLHKQFDSLPEFVEAFNAEFAEDIAKLKSDPEHNKRETKILSKMTTAKSTKSKAAPAAKKAPKANVEKTTSPVDKYNEALKDLESEKDFNKLMKDVEAGKYSFQRRKTTDKLEFKEYIESKKKAGEKVAIFNVVGQEGKVVKARITLMSRYVEVI